MEETEHNFFLTVIPGKIFVSIILVKVFIYPISFKQSIFLNKNFKFSTKIEFLFDNYYLALFFYEKNQSFCEYFLIKLHGQLLVVEY